MSRVHVTKDEAKREALDLGAFNGPFGDALERSRTAFEKTMKSLQDESLQFVKTRMDHTTKLIEESRHCDNMFELFAVQQKWMTNLARDYYEEGIRFGHVMQDWVRDAAQFKLGDVHHAEKDAPRS